ncbi:hypothetical protein SEA_HOLLOW_44 [Gordonia phage Hollow]|nr:hypothetical protein SEA_HOLLOW_44 [Gordonia phage Hollow]
MELNITLHLEGGKVEAEPIDIPGEEINDQDITETCIEEVTTEMENVDSLQEIVNRLTAWGFKFNGLEIESVTFEDDEEYGLK